MRPLKSNHRHVQRIVVRDQVSEKTLKLDRGNTWVVTRVDVRRHLVLLPSYAIQKFAKIPDLPDESRQSETVDRTLQNGPVSLLKLFIPNPYSQSPLKADKDKEEQEEVDRREIAGPDLYDGGQRRCVEQQGHIERYKADDVDEWQHISILPGAVPGFQQENKEHQRCD